MAPIPSLLLLLLWGSFSFTLQDWAAPRYNVSLDLPPEQRWKAILSHYNHTYLKESMEFIYNNETYFASKSHAVSCATILVIDVCYREPAASCSSGSLAPDDILAGLASSSCSMEVEAFRDM